MSYSTKIAGTGANVTGVGSYSWTSAAAVTSNDDAGAYANIDPYGSTNWLQATNFGFSIPSGATIDGIIVEYRRKAEEIDSIKDSVIKLIKGGTVDGNDKADTITAWSTSWEVPSRGGSGDLWGLTLTDSDVNASNFGVAISASCQGYSTTRADVDYVQITVYYTAATGSEGSASCSLSVSGVGAAVASATGSASAIASASAVGVGEISAVGSASASLSAEAFGQFEAFAAGSASASLTATAAARIIELPSQSATCVLPTAQTARSVLRTSWNAKAGIWRN